MGLPKIDAPLFSLELPSTGEKIKYRPFTVKEEKILLIAQESGDTDQIIESIKQIVNNCVISDKDVDDYPMFDIEYALMHVRAKSVNNVAKFSVTDPDTQEQVELGFNINDLKVSRPEGHNPEIQVNENTKLIMIYPGISQLHMMLSSMNNKVNNADMLSVMLQCIDSVIVDDDQVYKLSEYTEDEVAEFLEGLTSSAVDQIKTFFETMPRLRIEIPYKINDKEKKFVVEGLESFFM